jgi:hypothetical protein
VTAFELFTDLVEMFAFVGLVGEGFTIPPNDIEVKVQTGSEENNPEVTVQE